MNDAQQAHESEERLEEPSHVVDDPAPTAEELLERAHNLLFTAHVALDGWPQTVAWSDDYKRFKAQNAAKG